jgi:protein arginine N-methyltransferase 1
MITDRPRMDAYVQALRQAIQPGCVVLDIGAGTGIFSLLACRFGAGVVHAVEPDNSIQLAREMAHANAVADRITFHQAISTEITLPRKADVMIFDLRGVLPLFQHHIPSVIDARNRLLKPGGVMVPRRDHLWAAVVEDAGRYRPYVEPWLTTPYGIDLSAAQPLAVNNWRKAHFKPEQLLVRPQQWATLDYRSIEHPNVAGSLAWEAERSGTAHGLALWFDAELGEGIGFTNAPDQPELIYGHAFFPLQTPVAVDSGDRIEVNLQANLIGDDYVWNWNTRIRSGIASPKADFRQSTFYGAPLAPSQFTRHEAGYIPTMNEAAEIDRLCLQLIDGSTPLGDIARHLASRYPEQFPRWDAALPYVAQFWQRYAQPEA